MYEIRMKKGWKFAAIMRTFSLIFLNFVQTFYPFMLYFVSLSSLSQICVYFIIVYIKMDRVYQIELISLIFDD